MNPLIIMRRGLVVVACVLATLACGGAGGGAGKYGSVELKTYVDGRTRLAFRPGGTVIRKWANMSGDPVQGTYTQNGEEIEIHWEDAPNYGGRHEKLKQMGPCSIVMYYLKNKDGEVADWTKSYEQKEPSCDTIQVR
jgi:hypothetical protein